jgi:hypothetical protein
MRGFALLKLLPEAFQLLLANLNLPNIVAASMKISNNEGVANT